ncbi:Cell Wall Hydrolase [Novosphingobium sp. CF614]|nr:Cell Wall Hydrolase [Novosphingobium sp. CF614]
MSDPAALEALTPEEAQISNVARPISTLPNPAARPLIVPRTDDVSYQRSLDCLTAAIYYEAAFEPLEGQRAVAQVVLNRVRHPLYPHTVCGVVFQGSQRSTGCQFTFTCDGSLARIPNPAIWERMRNVAAAALAGFVYSPVGLSTHYHADYVVPYWADSLVKISSIGLHIFYRIDGSYGRPPAFAQAYAGNEPQTFERTAAGRFVLLSADGKPSLASTDQTTAPTARPILDSTGRILPATEDGQAPPKLPATTKAGTRSAALVALRADHKTAATSPAAPAPGTANRRWIIGMDGAAGPNKQALNAPGLDHSPVATIQ